MLETILDNWIKRYPELAQEEYNILLAEGLGDYRGKPNSYGKELHKLGRMGAELGIFKNGTLIYSTKNVSTLPDIPMDVKARFNHGSQTPTLCTGVYPLYTKLHGSKREEAFELGKGAEIVPVIRNSKQYIEYESISSGINLHHRSMNDSETWAWSTGCQTVLEEDFKQILKILGKWKNGKYIQGVYVGKIIIDRSQIPYTLQERYKKRYGKFYSNCFNTNDIVTNTSKDIPKWYKDGLDGLITDGANISHEYWEKKLGNNIKVGEFMAILHKNNNRKKQA
ncbi:hypothetical protein [Vallitalea guaymasensis]|uniref:hypothetical protein n=1 Tax=Vallitalea guaymasensis TaxID=1185412 RepID=UPI000DE202F9|nr:hypothetical protein [Vallitalea guaymasensis]